MLNIWKRCFFDTILNKKYFRIIIMQVFLIFPGVFQVSGETGVDSTGNRIILPDKGVRVVSISPGATEILYQLGLRDEIVGISDFCNYPPEFVKRKQRMGGFSTPNLELIQSVSPDLVIVTSVIPIQIKYQFDRLGIQLFVAEPKSFIQLLGLIDEFGKLFSHQKEAHELIQYMKEEAGKVTLAIRKKSIKPVRTFIEIWYDPIYIATRNTLPGDIVTLAGGEVVPEESGEYIRLSEEHVLQLDPEAFILGHNTDYNTFLNNHQNLLTVTALRNQKVFAPDPDQFLRPGPRVINSLRDIARFLHPEAF